MEVQPNRRGRPTLVEKPATVIEQPVVPKDEGAQELDNLLQDLNNSGLASKSVPLETKTPTTEKKQASPPPMFEDEAEVDKAVANFFSSEFRTAVIHAKDYAFHVRTLDTMHYLNGDIKVMDPEEIGSINMEQGLSEVFTKYFSIVYEYFIYSLTKIENKTTKDVLTLTQLSKYPKGHKDHYKSAAKTLSQVMGLELLMQVLIEYSRFYTEQQEDLLQKKNQD